MRHWTFDKKLRMFLLAVILPTTLAVLVTATWSSISSIGQKSRSLMQIQLDGASDDIAARLDRYRDMAVAVMLDVPIKRYLESPASAEPAVRDVNMAGARNTIASLCQVDGRIQFLAAIRSWPREYVFKGAEHNLFSQRYMGDLSASVPMGYGEFRLSRSAAYAGGEPALTAIYTPIYATTLPAKRTGALCLCVRDDLVAPVEIDSNAGLRFQTFLVSAKDGALVATSGGAMPDGPYERFDRFVGDGGSFEADGSLFAYKKVGRWAFYLVGEMPQVALYGHSVYTACALAALILLFVALSLAAASKMVARMYGSLGQLKRGMEAVKQGDLSARLRGDGAGEDFRTIYAGFNDMAGRIRELVEQVKAEQRQIERIRYDALQAQIHPHFLYNTLDCIRWMARADGNPELVRLVRALSQFYRICLSRGRDVITLREELTFTDAYMTIQNIRFAGVIHYGADVPEALMALSIPKITIQPLVENCVLHGLKGEAESFHVRVRGRVEAGMAVLTVEDDGAGMTEDRTDALNASLLEGGDEIGFGARNVHRRIALLFGPGAGLRYRRRAPGGVSVEIRLPLKEATEDV